MHETDYFAKYCAILIFHNMINEKKEGGWLWKKKTSENVWRSFNHTNSDDEHKRSFAKIPKNVMNGNPGIVFFVLISKNYITNVLYSRVKTIFSNKIHVNTKIDSDS
jgi:hypothetical protein